MKKAITLFALLFLILFTNRLNASHFTGSDLTYIHLGGNDYLIRLTFYRDCSGSTAPTSVTIDFSCGQDTMMNFSTTIPASQGTGQCIIQSCSAFPNQCSGGSNFGVTEWVYEKQVNLTPCNSWKISYTMCCRNPINTILNASTQSAYIDAILNNVSTSTNSSPVFSNKPVFVICSNQPFNYNQGAIDIDGDSLSYEFYTPMTTSSTATVSYLNGYTYNQPLPSNPPMTLNPITGDITMTPILNLTAPWAIKVKEWRKINGVMVNIGYVLREMQVLTYTCSSINPVLSGMDFNLVNYNNYNPNLNTYFTSTCPGNPVIFNIYGHDNDTFNPLNIGNPEKINITWNHGIPSASFTVYNQNTDSARARFFWIPTSADSGNIPKCFTATIHDLACPYYGIQSYSYCFSVNGYAVDLGSDTLLCQGENFLAVANGDAALNFYKWYLDGNQLNIPLQSPNYLFQSSGVQPGNHKIKVNASSDINFTNCTPIDEINIKVVYQPNVNLGNDTALYLADTIVLDAGPGNTYYWLPIGSLSRYLILTSIFDHTTSYIVTVDGGNGTRCIDSDTIKVTFSPTAGLKENFQELNCKIAPNPNNGSFEIILESTDNQSEIEITVTDITGKTISIEQVKISAGINKIPVNIQGLAKGSYFLRVSDGSKTYQEKIMIE